MTSPELLKRNLKILRMYDSGDYSRKAIYRALNLSSIEVVNYVIRSRILYERDRRAPSILRMLRQNHRDNLHLGISDGAPGDMADKAI